MPSRASPMLAACLLTALSPSAAQNVSEIQMAPPQVTLKVGERLGLAATAFDRAGNVIPTARFQWVSSNPGVVRVDNNGTVTGVTAGVAMVEARAGARKGATAIHVVGAPAAGAAPPPPAAARPRSLQPFGADPPAGQPPGSGTAVAVRIEPPAVYLLPSENLHVAALALRDDGGPASPVSVSWTSLVPAIASVDAHGTVVALTPGRGTIQVSAPGGLTAAAPVVVEQADFVIREGPLLLSPGEPDTVHAVVPAQNGREISPVVLAWSSSDTSVVRVSPTGALTPIGAGRATVTVAGLLQTRAIEVAVHRPVAMLVARPRAANEIAVPLSGSTRFHVAALAADNTPVPEAPIRWSLSDTAVASFDPVTGVLLARSTGRTLLTARAPGGNLAVVWTVNVAAGR